MDRDTRPVDWLQRSAVEVKLVQQRTGRGGAGREALSIDQLEEEKASAELKHLSAGTGGTFPVF